MSRPSQARARRGLKTEAEQLTRPRGRPRTHPAPTPVPAPGAAPPAAAPVAGAPPENQGKEFGLMMRAITAPLYRAVCGAELPPAAWEEWGIAGGKFAAYYVPAIALHPGYQFAGATAVLAAPLLLSWPAYTARRRAQLAKAKAEAAAAKDGAGPPAAADPPAAPPGPARRPDAGGSVIGRGWDRMPPPS